MSLATLTHVTKRFGSVCAVDDVSLELGPGEILGLLGANGAGKTTLIRMVCGLLRPDAGTVSIVGRPGYLCQDFCLVEELTVSENIDLYGALYGLSRREAAERREAVISQLSLADCRDRQVRYLPSGWRQALSFSIAVLSEPEVLVLDEPGNGLDPLSRKRIWQQIRTQAAAGAGVIVSTHSLDEAWHCDRIAVLHNGKLIACGAPGQVAPSADALLRYFI